jgi:hypothetical protein
MIYICNQNEKISIVNIKTDHIFVFVLTYVSDMHVLIKQTSYSFCYLLRILKINFK